MSVSMFAKSPYRCRDNILDLRVLESKSLDGRRTPGIKKLNQAEINEPCMGREKVKKTAKDQEGWHSTQQRRTGLSK